MRPSVLTSRQYHQDRFFRVSTSTDAYKFSFIPRTITDWNWLPQGIIQAPSTDVFRAGVCGSTNPFWDSKPELFSDIACLRILYQPCIVLFGIFFPGTPASNRRELRLHLNVVPTGAGVFKSRHILLHKYVNRIMIIYQ
jgi:hypothetical protein